MSLVAMTWAIEAHISRPTAKLALVCLADHADAHGACFPSQKMLAAKVGVTDRALRDALTWLVAQGFVTRARRNRRDGSRASDTYQLPDEACRKNSPPPRKQTQGLPEKSSALTTFEPVTEPTSVAAPAKKPEAVLDKLLAAAGLGEMRIEKSPKLLDLSPILGLIDAGYDLDRDIIALVRARNVNGFRPRSWAFYVEAIRDASATRNGIAAVAKPGPKPIDWEGWCTAFFKDATWIQALGPKPDEPGCKAPAHIVAHARQLVA